MNNSEAFIIARRKIGKVLAMNILLSWRSKSGTVRLQIIFIICPLVVNDLLDTKKDADELQVGS